jgi:hypothetical protein
VEGLFFYKPGDILLIHIDNVKNAEWLNKKRRTFNRLATFLGYDHGNVVCQVLYNNILRSKNTYDRPITIPIFYTKYIARSFKDTEAFFKSRFLKK